MLRLSFCIVCLLSLSGAFLLDSSTQLPKNGQLMTNDHYETLFRLFLDERKNRMQLQQYVLSLEVKFDKLTQNCNSCNNISLQQLVTRKNNETGELEALALKFESMKLKLEIELKTSKNRTSMLEQEVKNLKQVESNDQLQTLSNVKQQVQTIIADVQSLLVTKQARSQDLTAMYSEINASKQRTTVVERNVKTLDNKQIIIMANMTILRDDIEKTVNAKIGNITRKIQENSEYVGFTAFGTVYGTRPSGYQLKFPDIKYSYGISNLSSIKNSGTFICEKKGLYLITVTVMVCSKIDSIFYIYKNYQALVRYYIGSTEISSGRGCNSGTGTAVVELRVNDALNVRNTNGGVQVYEDLSSFSAVRLK